jgi:hypothetical protein
MVGRLYMLAARRLSTGFALSALAAALCAVPADARVLTSFDAVAPAVAPVVEYSFANTDGYQVSEDVGNYPLVIDRDDASAPGVICSSRRALATPGRSSTWRKMRSSRCRT